MGAKPAFGATALVAGPVLRVGLVAALLCGLALASVARAEAEREVQVAVEQRVPLAGDPASTTYATVFWSVVDLFRDFYWDPEYLDWDDWAGRHEEGVLAARRRAAFDTAMFRMVAEVGDDHSRWLGLTDPVAAGSPAGRLVPLAESPSGAGVLAAQAPERPDPTEDPRPHDSLGSDLDGDLTRGLGLQVRYLVGSGVVVERVLPGTPAAEGGLRRGDVIQSIDELDLKAVGPGAVGLVMAESLESVQVRLGVLRGGRDSFEVTLVPRLLSHATLELTASASMLADDVAYLYLPSFTLAGTGQLTHALLAELARSGARTYVVDLRGNLGGNLSELGIFMGAFYDGEWARAQSRGDVAWHATFERHGPFGTALLVDDAGRVIRSAVVADPVKLDAPLVVIVDRLTSSAAEVAAAVLQASGRAKVVGAATDGNVEVVQAFELADGSSVLVAVANLELPDGGHLDAGIEPDAVAAANVRELARGYDAPLASAVAQLSDLPFTPGRWF